MVYPCCLLGDEFGNSQYGNNNAYCQDNEITWLKWNVLTKPYLTLPSKPLHYEKKFKVCNRRLGGRMKNVEWLNTGGNPMTLDDWHNRESKAPTSYVGRQISFLN